MYLIGAASWVAMLRTYIRLLRNLQRGYFVGKCLYLGAVSLGGEYPIWVLK